MNGSAILLDHLRHTLVAQAMTGLSDGEVLDQVKIWVTTLGKNGARIQGREIEPLHVPVARETHIADPTGVGDGFRAGFFAGLSWGLSLERSAQIGSLLATQVLETVGGQEYVVKPDEFLDRLAESYGPACADDVRPHLPL